MLWLLPLLLLVFLSTCAMESCAGGPSLLYQLLFLLILPDLNNSTILVFLPDYSIIFSLQGSQFTAIRISQPSGHPSVVRGGTPSKSCRHSRVSSARGWLLAPLGNSTANPAIPTTPGYDK